MHVCLIVEDGSSVEDANTYLTVEEATKMLWQLGYDFGEATETEIEQYLIRSAFYLESFDGQYKGQKTDSNQGLAWPRACASYYGGHCASSSPQFASNEIPKNIKRAQALGAYYESIGTSLQCVSDGKKIASEEVVSAVKVSYFETGATEGTKIFEPINNLLSPLLSGSSGQLKVGRA